MTPAQTTPVNRVLVGVIVIVIVLFIWSVNQNTALMEDTRAAESRNNEMNREIAVLHEEISRLKLEMGKDSSENRFESPEIIPLKTGSPGIEEVSDRKITAAGTIGSGPGSDLIANEKLQDMPDLPQESSGLAEGKIAFSSLDYESAIEKFAKVETDTADFIRARLGIANAYFYTHQYEKAVAEFTYVLGQQNDSVEAAIGLANAHQRLGQTMQQIAAYDRAIKIEPGKWLHYNSRATAHLVDGNYDRAIEDFLIAAEKALPNQGDQATALENIGLIYLRQGQWLQAFQHADSVNHLDRTHSWNWLVRGIAATKLERNVDAYVSFDKWFQLKRATDPYLLKQLLPESVFAYIDVSPKGLAKLVDPPFISGDRCENDYQCRSLSCRPGPPDNSQNYCVAEDRVCSAANSNGYLPGETMVVDGVRVRCYQPDSANPRWTLDNRSSG